MPKKTKEQLSYNMRQVKNKDSEIEVKLRKELWLRGLRYQKNVTGIVGKPDIVFKGKKVAVFCDSEFRFTVPDTCAFNAISPVWLNSFF